MAIRNYTSKKSPAETIGKIQQLLSEHGAQQVTMDYSDGIPQAITFTMDIGDVIVPFRLTVNVEGMLQAMKEDSKVSNSYCSMQQARRTAWKNKYDWLDAQMAEIATQQAQIEQLLLGYAVTPEGQTLFDHIKNNQKLLPSHEQQRAHSH